MGRDWKIVEPDLHAHLADPRQRFMMAVRLYYSGCWSSRIPGCVTGARELLDGFAVVRAQHKKQRPTPTTILTLL